MTNPYDQKAVVGGDMSMLFGDPPQEDRRMEVHWCGRLQSTEAIAVILALKPGRLRRIPISMDGMREFYLPRDFPMSEKANFRFPIFPMVHK